MIITQYYNFEAPELTDAPDVSYLGNNWEDLDLILHDKADLGTDGKVPAEQLPAMNYVTPGGDGSTITISFTEAATEIDIATGDTLAVIAGKLLKNINSLQTATGNNAAAISNMINGNTQVGSASDADTVNGLTVGTAVPVGAKFTDTVYTHPASHPASMITGLPTSLPANGGTSTATYFVNSPDGDRIASNKLPQDNPNRVRFDFVGASSAGGGGSYAGVMTYSPWTGTTASTGDASYQVAFCSTAINGGGLPFLNLRKGIDATWNAWYRIIDTGSSERSTYKGVTDGVTVGQLMWKAYGSGHTIFDASASTTPTGVACSNTDPQIAWSSTYPTLMGYNGGSTFGVRVDEANKVDGKHVWVGAEASRGSDGNTLYFCY